MSQPRSPKPRYRTNNWPSYNAALKSRGSLTIWLDKHMQWFAAASGKRLRVSRTTCRRLRYKPVEIVVDWHVVSTGLGMTVLQRT